MKILFVVSTLKKAGPINQLFNLIKHDNQNNNFHILSLSPEPNDSRVDDFENIGVICKSLNLSRLNGLLKSKRLVSEFITGLKPDVIHSQGIRADSLISKIKPLSPWVITAHNYPYEDYTLKFGALKGRVMAHFHLKALGQCSNLISCSRTIKQKLAIHKINSIAIQNGVLIRDNYFSSECKDLTKKSPVFISVGSLISRKNMSFLINAFIRSYANTEAKLYILGGGVEFDSLRALSSSHENIILTGNVNNVSDYLKDADCFISSSLSEGLPNTVLEAMSFGIPCLLSDIPSHREIKDESNDGVRLFDLLDENGLSELVLQREWFFSQKAKNDAFKTVSSSFNASVMSDYYIKYYNSIFNGASVL